MLSLIIICLSMAFPVAFSITTTCDQVDGIRPPTQDLLGVNWYAKVVYPYNVNVQCFYYKFSTDNNGNLASIWASASTPENISDYNSGSMSFYYPLNATNNNVNNSGNDVKFLAYNDGSDPLIPRSFVMLGCNPIGVKGAIFICTADRDASPEDVINIENAVNKQWPSLNIQPANNTYINQAGCNN